MNLDFAVIKVDSCVDVQWNPSLIRPPNCYGHFILGPLSRSSRLLPGPLSCLFSIPDGSFKSFENYTVKLLDKETKWTSLEVRTHPICLETLISKYDDHSGPLSCRDFRETGPGWPEQSSANHFII